jgi:hypothetical protein
VCLLHNAGLSRKESLTAVLSKLAAEEARPNNANEKI